MRGLALAALLFAHGCGDDRGPNGDPGCGVTPDVGPMTEARARRLAPDVEAGLAVSVTRVFGDCRPRASEAPPVRDPCGDGLCVRSRAPLRVLVLPGDANLPVDPACGGAPTTAAAAALAVVDAEASRHGELVVELPPGTYRPHLAGGGGCAPCGIPGAGACAVTVPVGGLAARDLVLDEAAH